MKLKVISIIGAAVLVIALALSGVALAQTETYSNRALVDDTTGEVVNIVILSSTSKWIPPSGTYLLSAEITAALKVGIGDIYINDTVTKPDQSVLAYDPFTKEVTEVKAAPIIDKKAVVMQGTNNVYAILLKQYESISDKLANCGLALDLESGFTYEIEAVLGVQSASIAGVKYGLGYSGSNGNFTGLIYGNNSGILAKIERITAFNTASSSFITTTGSGCITIKGLMYSGSGGTLTIQQGGTAVIYDNSYMKVVKIQ